VGEMIMQKAIGTVNFSIRKDWKETYNIGGHNEMDKYFFDKELCFPLWTIKLGKRERGTSEKLSYLCKR